MKWIITGLLVLAAGIALGVYMYYKVHQVAYIKTAEVYNAFELKKELEGKLKKVEQSRQAILDSLRINFNLFAKTLEQEGKKAGNEKINHLNLLREQYLQREEQFRQENESTAQAYNNQIWEQLNQYIKDYGTNYKYRYIFGANGDGALLYANDAEDITSEVKAYINSRYKGNTK